MIAGKPSRARSGRSGRGLSFFPGDAQISRSETARYSIPVTLDCRAALQRLAVDHGASASETLADLVLFALDRNARLARQTLRIER